MSSPSSPAASATASPDCSPAASPAPALSIAQRLAQALVASTPEADPRALPVARRLLLDIAGICVAARHEPYVHAAIASIDQPGPCTVIGFDQTMGVEGAAFVNGTAAHGEDFDDTYEGGPVHAGAVVVPAVLAAAQRHGASGAELLRGIALGVEVTCRLCAVAPMQIGRAHV